MTDEVPLVKPIAKNLNAGKIPLRPISEGHKLSKEIPPEIQRNMPSKIEEKEEEEKEKDKIEKKTPQGLNINAPSFTPKNKIGDNQKNQHNNSNPTYDKKHLDNYNNNNRKGNGYYNQPYNYNAQQFSNRNPNGNYMNDNYGNLYTNQGFYQMPQQQMSFPPQQFFNQQNFMNQGNHQYNNNSFNRVNFGNYGKNPNYTMPSYNKAPNQEPDPAQNNNKPLVSSKLKLGADRYIPKSMRKQEEKINENNLNLNADSHIPQNTALKKKEEEIQIQKLKENENKLKEEEKNKKEKQEKIKDNEKEKESKELFKKEEKSTETLKETNKFQEQKKKSNLALLLEKNDSKESKKPKNKKSEEEPAPTYMENKKKLNLYEKKYEKATEREKKLKLEEEKRKKEDKKRKEEEERKRLEEEKRRKEEEKKRKAEEERLRKLELEEKKKREEEEERKRKEEEERRKEIEEKRKEEERRIKEEEEKNKVIEKKYFITFKNKKSDKKEYKYTFEYIMQFRKWKISNEEYLLTEATKQHFENFKEEEKDAGKPKKKDNQKSSYYKPKNSTGPNYVSIQVKEEPTPQTVTTTPENAMEQWARKDMTKEFKAAEEFKQKLEETIKDDPIKRNLRNYLNMLTKDNYEKTKNNILETIKDNVEYQEKFLDVLFQKAVSERAYVELYAILCKDLDKELPQKNPSKPKKEGDKKKETSVMRAKLLEKCRVIFQIENNEKFDEYIKEKDPEERENKLKKFVLGNVYFITELIKIKILSKKIAPVCIKNLFKRYEKEEGDEKLKLINIQAIVIFTDQFGTLVHSQGKKIVSKDAEEFKKSIDEIFQKLDIVKDEKGLPGHIKYSIINLIEKRKNNYQKSKLEEYRTAKSKKEVEKELENQEQITQDNINDKIKRGLSDYRDFIEEEGDSAKYPWQETTFLYDKKEKGLDDILEGYIVSCGDFIEKESNIKFAKDYIKELIEYYSDKIKKKEKKDLKIRLFKLLEIARSYAFETPEIYDIYAYVIYIFISNDIMGISDLEEIKNEKDSIDDDFKNVSIIFEKVYKYYKDEKFKEDLSKFSFINNNTEMFKWVYNTDENKEEEENKDE